MTRITLFAPLALALATPAFASPAGHRHPGPEHALEHAQDALDQVDATDAQQDSVRSILEGAMPQLLDYRDEGRQLRDELKGLFHAETLDPVAIEGARTDLVDLFDRATSTLFGIFVDVSEVLTVEQRQELHEVRQERRRRWRRAFGASD
ncbi:MAG: periplasmic heavy metal sensor [Myxococcales bacterium]|nr:periplasmic heavy metal sensor [Myxococcales bacterium]